MRSFAWVSKLVCFVGSYASFAVDGSKTLSNMSFAPSPASCNTDVNRGGLIIVLAGTHTSETARDKYEAMVEWLLTGKT